MGEMTRSGWKLSVAAAVMSVGGMAAWGSTVAQNTGSLGAAANGVHGDAVTFGPGVVPTNGDQTAVYDESATAKTVVTHQAALNPASTSPFTIEFWANPTDSDNDDAPVSNRLASSSPRSGWVFFQRNATTGWNFRMYDGNGSNLGWDLTGGTATLNSWSHVVATWDGSAASLFVNGALASSTNAAGASGGYAASSAADFIVAASDTGSPYLGSVDEVAFYPTALSETQILNHFNSISSGGYQAQVRSDGALLQLSNNDVPEPSAMMLMGVVGAMVMGRRRR